MVNASLTHKIYCFVDESGQDTGGRLFFVSVVVVGEDRHGAARFLEECEAASGRKRGQKWMKSTHPQRLAFIRLAFDPSRLGAALFYQEYRDTKEYDKLTVLTILEAIHLYAAKHSVENYSVTVVVDGLKAKQEAAVATHLRRAGMPVRKVRGMRDEGDALLRLADFVAGLVRSAGEDRSPEYAEAVEKFLRKGLLQKL